MKAVRAATVLLGRALILGVLAAAQAGADSAADGQLRMSLVQPGDGGEKEGPPGWAMAFQHAVQSCWVVNPETAGEIVVTVAFDLDPEGRVDMQSLSLVRASEGTETDVQRAYDSARRAILRCQTAGGDGYDLPLDLYERWKRVELTFDPRPFALR